MCCITSAYSFCKFEYIFSRSSASFWYDFNSSCFCSRFWCNLPCSVYRRYKTLYEWFTSIMSLMAAGVSRLAWELTLPESSSSKSNEKFVNLCCFREVFGFLFLKIFNLHYEKRFLIQWLLMNLSDKKWFIKNARFILLLLNLYVIDLSCYIWVLL